MRRFLCFAIAALMLLTLAACGEEQKKDPTDAATTAITEPASTTEEPTGDLTEDMTEEPTEESALGNHDVLSLDFIRSFDQNPAIEEQDVYEKDGVKITAKELRYDTVNGPQITLEILNDSDRELLIQNSATVVNGYMMKPELNANAAPGKKTQAVMSLPYIGLAMADVHSLYELEISLSLLDSKTYAVVDTTEPISLMMTGTTEPTDEPDTSGQVVYDKKGIKVIVQGVKHDTLFDSDSVLTVYMENNTDKAICVQNKSLTVNGYEITAAMQTALMPGKKAVDMIELSDKELDEYGVTSLDNIVVTFDINDNESWDLIATTKKLSVEIPTEPPTEATEATAAEEATKAK